VDLLETICISPVVLLAFAVGENPAPERSAGERGGGKIPPLQKPYKTKGESMLKEDLTSVIGYLAVIISGLTPCKNENKTGPLNFY
jgi:hypothetical protein